MKNTIFYSWQSNLPNSTNRGFIEQCIRTAIKKIEKSEEIHLDVNLERDTLGIIGTPDIVETLFNKIDSCKLFIADVSIINSNTNERKTPNPNVLLELGYAAKAIGWDRVLCFYNIDYGDIEDLPFDIKFRRIIPYSLKNSEKSELKIELATKIKNTIEQLFFNRLLIDDINDFFKSDVDTQILTILKSLSNILYGYDNIGKGFENIQGLKNLSLPEIEAIVSNKEFIGFQVYKNFREVDEKLTLLFKDFVSSNYFVKDLGVIVANIIKWIKVYNKFISFRTSPNLFISTSKVHTDYFLLNSKEINPTNNDGFLLLKKIDGERGQIVDFGDIKESSKIEGALDSVYINKSHLLKYCLLIKEFLELIELWLDNTNGEFIIDNIENFEVRNRKLPYMQLEDKPIHKALSITLNNEIHIDYYQLSIFNAISVLKSYGYILSEDENHHKMIHRYTALKFSVKDHITSLVNTPIAENPTELIDSTKEKYESLKKKQIYVDSVYLPHIFVNTIKSLILLKNSLLLAEIDKSLNELLDKINENIAMILPKILEKFILEVYESDSSKINIELLGEEFEKKRIYHERETNALLRKLRKMKLQQLIE